MSQNYSLKTALGESILTVLGCLVPFLEVDLLDMLPYTVASTLAAFPSSLQGHTVQLLCTNLLPITLGGWFQQCNCFLISPVFEFSHCGLVADLEGMSEDQTYATESTAAILMMVLQYVEQSGKLPFC